MRCHFTPIRIAIPKNKTENKTCCQECGEIGSLVFCSRECKMVQLLWRKVWSFLKKKKKIEVPYGPTILLLDIFPKELKAKS